MRRTLFAVLLGTSVLGAGSALAQQPAAPPPAPQAQPAPPPTAAAPAAPAPSAAAPAQSAAPRTGPVNLCQELVAFLRQPPAAPAAAPAQTPPAQATQTSAGPQASGTGSSVPQGGAAPAVEAPKAPAAPPQGQNATPPQQSGQPAPIPQAAGAGTASPVSLQEVEALAQANDIAGCREAGQKMRKAGVKMPDALIALAGLRLDLLQQHR